MSMQLTCLDLLPYPSQYILDKSKKIISILNELSFIIEIFIESKIAYFEDKNYLLFDPHPEETCCEVRTILLMMRTSQISKSPFEMRYQIDHLNRMKKNIAEKIEFYSMHLKFPIHTTLVDFFQKNELVFLANITDQYIFIAYFLSVAHQKISSCKISKQLLSHYESLLPQLSKMMILHLSSDHANRKQLQKSLQQAKKQAEAVNRAKTEFLENMRHDIRTPLTGIVGFARLIQKEAKSPHTKKYADSLVEATIALLDFQNEILDAIKITAETVPVLQQPFQLKTLVEKVLNLMRPKAIVKKLLLTCRYDASLPRLVSSDPKRLFRILLELTANALKFTAEGSIDISLAAIKNHQHQFVLQCEITDTGIGIPQDQQEEIFVRFHRLSAASDGVYEGTGLGLTIVKQYIQELGGKIIVHSDLGRGTRFTCYIPMMLADESLEIDSTQTETRIESNEKILFEPKKILLIEDHTLTATVTELLFKELSCQVDVVSDANMALLQSQKKHYDLIFMDLGLPDESGYDLAKKIRHSKQNLNQYTDIIALTAHSEEENKSLCLESGIDAIVQKPLLKSTAITLLNTIFCDDITSKPIIDLSLGATRIGKQANEAKAMIDLLSQNIHQDHQAISHALIHRDWKTLESVSHRLLGGLAYCGAPRLEAATLQLQTTLKKGDFDHIPRFARRVLAEIDQIKMNSVGISQENFDL